MVAVVEVFDRELRSCAQLVVSEEPVVVELPGPGKYFVRGWLPDGAAVEALVSTTDDPADIVDIRLTAAWGAVSGELVETARWAMPWRFVEGRWESTGPPVGLGGRCRDLVGEPHGAGRPLAIQLGTADGPTFTVIALSDVPLRVAERTGRAEAVVRLNTGVSSALLAYLAVGDVRSAGVVVSHVLADRPKPGSEPLRDLAVGYYLLRTGDERFAAWAAALARRMPRSPDAQLLAAYRRLRTSRGSLRVAKRQLLASVALGVPVIATGLQLLADGLAGFDTEGRKGQAVSTALKEVRRYQRASVPGVLTTFIALNPNLPMPGAGPPADGAAMVGSPTWRELFVHEKPLPTSSRWRLATLRMFERAQAQFVPAAAVFATAAGVGIAERSLLEIVLGPLSAVAFLLGAIARPAAPQRSRDSASEFQQAISVPIPEPGVGYPAAELRRLVMHTPPFNGFEVLGDGVRTSAPSNQSESAADEGFGAELLRVEAGGLALNSSGDLEVSGARFTGRDENSGQISHLAEGAAIIQQPVTTVTGHKAAVLISAKVHKRKFFLLPFGFIIRVARQAGSVAAAHPAVAAATCTVVVAGGAAGAIALAQGPPPSLAAAPVSFAGLWQGTVSEPGKSGYPVDVDITGGPLQGTVGSVNLTTLSCTSTLTLSEAHEQKLTIRDDTALGSCLSGTLVLTPQGDELRYTLTHTDGSVATGTLKRVQSFSTAATPSAATAAAPKPLDIQNLDQPVTLVPANANNWTIPVSYPTVMQSSLA